MTGHSLKELPRNLLGKVLQEGANGRERHGDFGTGRQFDPIKVGNQGVIQTPQIKGCLGAHGVCHKDQRERQQHPSTLLGVRLAQQYFLCQEKITVR